jgi:hypothetical protein
MNNVVWCICSREKGHIMFLVKEKKSGRILAGLFEAIESEHEAKGAADYFIEKKFVEEIIIEKIEENA